MANFKQEKNILQHLERARKAITRKYRLIKNDKDEVEKALNETFKPIVDPLEKFIKANRSSLPSEPLPTPHLPPTPQSLSHSSKVDNDDDDDDDNYKSDFEIAVNDDVDDTTTQNNSVEFDDNSHTDHYLMTMLDRNNATYLDKIYGVCLENNEYKIGSARIYFGKTKIKIENKEYPITDGLMELLLAKQPKPESIKQTDLKNYQKILELSNAQKKGFNKN